jgi:hypothetical protein
MNKVNFASYQIPAAYAVLKNALDNRYIASVLAACPSAGKTTISHIIINKYLKLFPGSNVVILTEAQNILKDQYIDELEHANIKLDFEYGIFGSKKQVQIGLPQSIYNIDFKKIDLLIVDEAHRWFLENTDQEIIKKYNPRHIIVMTGSPTVFNLHNSDPKNKPYGMYYISAQELQDLGVFNAVNLDIIEIENKKDVKGILDSCFEQAIKKGSDLSKIMIACPDIQYANKARECLKTKNRKISLSTSENDSDNLQIKDFKAGLTDTLIVINKGILGFNEKTLTCMFDLKSSSNIDSSYQLFARMLRVHPYKDVVKSYYRIAEKKQYNNGVYILHKMRSLMDKKTFREYTGDNLKIVKTYT